MIKDKAKKSIENKEYFSKNPTYKREWRERNREHIKEYYKKYRIKHSEKFKIYRKKYKQYDKEYRIKYKLKFPDKVYNEHKNRVAKRERQLGFIPINKRFPNSEAHHINREYVIYLPKDLHRSIAHSVFKNRNMAEINKRAFTFLKNYSALLTS